MDLISRLKTLLQQKEQRAVSNFEELASSIARGEEPRLDEVARVLEASGKTPDDLAQAVDREKSKATARMAIAEGERAAIALAQVEGEISKHDRALSEAREKHGKAVTPLIARRDQLKVTVTAGQQARQKLLQSPPAEVAQELGDIGRATLEKQNRLAFLGEALHNARGDLAKAVRMADSKELTRSLESVEASQQRVDTARRRVEDLERQVEDLRAEMNHLTRQRELVEGKTLAAVVS